MSLLLFHVLRTEYELCAWCRYHVGCCDACTTLPHTMMRTRCAHIHERNIYLLLVVFKGAAVCKAGDEPYSNGGRHERGPDCDASRPRRV